MTIAAGIPANESYVGWGIPPIICYVFILMYLATYITVPPPPLFYIVMRHAVRWETARARTDLAAPPFLDLRVTFLKLAVVL